MPAFVMVPDSAVDAVTASRVTARLSAGDRARLESYEGEDPRIHRFLAGRCALLTAADRLGEHGIEIAAPCPDCGLSHGRPTASGTVRPLYLSLAHADGLAFAVASRAPVGIDAEAAGTDASRIAAIDDLAPGRGHPLRRWTALEAVLKADGRGLRVAPDAIHVGRWSASFDGGRYRLRTTRANGCVVTIATRPRAALTG
jgi:phosphopantetheinyl transferase